MVTMPLDMRYIYRRDRGLERRKCLSESTVKVPDLTTSMNKTFYKKKVEDYINECSSYQDALHLLETLYNDNHFDILEATTQKIINDIIPTVESAELPNCISMIESIDIGDVNKDRLIESAKIYKSVDRIRKNHRNLSKRFEMNFKGKSDKEKCYSICEMVDTYSMSRFIKFNIALEELSYLGYSDGCKMLDENLVKYVSDYFLMISENTQEDIDSYKRAITTSKVITEGADVNVPYLMNGAKHSTYWKDKINEWKVDPNKSIDTLIEITKENYSNIGALNSIIETIDEFTRINDIKFDKMSLFDEFGNGIDVDAARNIITIIRENKISDPKHLVENLKSIWEAEINDEVYADGTKIPETFTSDEIDKFTMHNMVVDAMNVGEFLNQLEKTSMKETPLKIGKVAVADDTAIEESSITDHVDANGFITMKLRSYTYEGSINEAYELLESSINCINNMLYGRKSKAFYTIGENQFDISIRSTFKVMLSEAQEINRGIVNSDKQTLCNINRYLEAAESIYESKLGLIVEKLRTDRSYAAMVTPQEASFVYEMLNPYLDRDNNIMTEFAELCREEANPKYDKIMHEFSLIDEEAFNIYDDHATRIEFCANFLGITEGAVDNIQKAVGDLKNKVSFKKNPAVGVNQTKEIDNKEQEDPKKQEEKKVPEKQSEKDNEDIEDEEDVAKEDKISANTKSSADDPQRAIKSLNDAKLAWQGVKSKMKNASAKEQEMSRDLDLEYNHLLKTLKSAYTVDHREEIITGEVNHSLSKVIKIGIGLAGIGLAAHSAVLPIIGAVALFAKSKFTSNKEKKMILDEIDTELEVLDREIQRAESSGSTKKYRQLLTIKKNLQRKRQEIYYGLAKKGKRIPMQSTVGLRARE